MKKCRGFSLMELLLGLSIFSIFIIALGKLQSCFMAKRTRVREQRLLLPYLDAFEHFLSQKNAFERCGDWFCYQDRKTKERIFQKEYPKNVWRYKIQVKFKKTNMYEVNFLGKTRQLCKTCYCFKNF